MPVGDLSAAAVRIEVMRRAVATSLSAGVLVLAGAGSAGGAPKAGRSGTLLIQTRAGSSLARAAVSEPAGVIRRFRVVAPAGASVRVIAVISGVAGVSIALPRERLDPSETCTQRGGSVACTQAEEACPMPAATWRVRVRKLAGPAGRIRIDFVVGPERAA